MVLYSKTNVLILWTFQECCTMIGSMIVFVLLIIFYITIADIITILFRLTGMTEERARFQVISLLTNSGFTTQESEEHITLMEKLIDIMEDDDDVQNLWHNWEE